MPWERAKLWNLALRSGRGCLRNPDLLLSAVHSFARLCLYLLLQRRLLWHLAEVLNGILHYMAPCSLKKALLFRAVDLFLRLEVEPALEQVASPRLEEGVVLPLQDVQVVRWRGGGRFVGAR